MPEKSFVKLGYNQNGTFIPSTLRARDIESADGKTLEEHVTAGSIHLTAEQSTLIANAIQTALLGAASGVATLDASGHVPAAQLDLGKYQTSANVATYAEMLALTATQAKINTFVFVADATDDSTVDEGWASYKRVATNGNASDYVKVAEVESLDISFPELEQGVNEAKNAASVADGKAVAAQTAAETADGKAVAAQNAANTADSKAVAAQNTADAAALEAAKLDFAYCTSEADMASMNLRNGAMVLMAVDND